MPKMKTKKAVARRFKLTATGQLKRKQGYRQHDAWAKSAKQKRKLRKSKLVHPSDAKRLKGLI